MRKMTWRQAELNGRIRSKGIQFPRRERVLMRKALDKLKLHYMEIVPIHNPFWHGYKGQYPEGTVVWFDFFYLMPNKRMGCILFHPKLPNHGLKTREKDIFESRKKLLEHRGIPYIIVPRYYTSDEYAIALHIFHRRLK